MKDNNRIIEEFQAKLFELTYRVDDFNRQEMMDALCNVLKEKLHISHAALYILNKWQLDDQLAYFVTENPIEYFKPAIGENNFMSYFNQADNLTLIENNNPITKNFPNQSTLLLKLENEENYCALMLMSFTKEVEICTKLMEKVRVSIEQFVNIIYNKRQYNYIQARKAHLFKLATQLHSVHKMTEALEHVYETMRQLYPTFDYYLLMTQEYEHDTLPIRMIEYTGEAAESPGTIAFINNELQVEYNNNNETYLYLPLSGNQGVYGVLQIVVHQQVSMVQEEKEFMKQLSKMVGRAIERTTLHQSSNKLASDLQIINIASQDLNLNLDQHEITETIKKHVFQSCQAEQIGIVFFNDDEEEKVETFDILKESTSYFSTKSGIDFVQYIYKQMIKNQKPILSGNFKNSNVDTPYNSMMIIPLWGFDSVFGVIIIAHPKPYYFSFDKYKFIQTFIQHASLAFSNSILKEKLERTAITDYLTKLYSRNHLDKVIEERMHEDCCGAFILFDIDDFKLINDTYGHYIGDKVLIQVANVLKSEVKMKEVAARWGGEEFAVYLPNCNIQEATKKANVIREKVVKGTNPKVSLSSGVSVWEAEREDTIEQLFIRTDKALYEAKLSGKNKVVQHIF